MTVELALFLAVGAFAILCAAGMILSRNAVHSALFLIANFGSVAFMFILLDAPFIAMVQVAVYAGAIMVLFLFVIMLLGAEQTTDTTRKFRWFAATVLVLAIIFMGVVGIPLAFTPFVEPEVVGPNPNVRVIYSPFEDTQATISLVGDDTVALTTEGFGEETFVNNDRSNFVAVEPDEYAVNVTAQLPEAEFAYDESTVILDRNDNETLVIYGSIGDETFTVSEIDEDLSPVESGYSRVTVFNAFSQEPVTVVDLGANSVLDMRVRPVVDENGEPVLDENETPVEEQQIGDVVLVEDVAYGEYATVVVRSGNNVSLEFLTTNRVDANTLQTQTVATLSGDIPSGLTTSMVLAPRGGEENLTNPIVVLFTAEPTPSFGSPESIGVDLFTTYLLPVQIVGLLLLVALIGVVALTRPFGVKRERTQFGRRRKVSRPLINVVSQQTGSDILNQDAPRLDSPTQPEASGD